MYLLIILLIIILLVLAIMYNSIIKLKRKVEQSKSGIDVYCQQRFDLIPNLVKTVKEYANYESKVLENITSLREQYFNTKDLTIGEELNNKVNKVLIAIDENYPDLKASEQFLNLQKNLVKTENQLQAARRIYNMDVTAYNTKISIVPFNIIAMIFKFKPAKLFEIDEK